MEIPNSLSAERRIGGQGRGLISGMLAGPTAATFSLDWHTPLEGEST
jgi:hypothetical protein